MTITILGIIFFVLTIGSIFSKKLVHLLIFSAMFQGGAVLTVTTGFKFGLIPFYLIEMLIVMVAGMRIISSRKFICPQASRSSLILFSIFLMWVIPASLVLPSFFKGVPVFAPRLGLDSQVEFLEPLRFSFSLIGQDIYLLLNYLTFCALLGGYFRFSSKNIESSISFCTFVLLIILMWQLASFYLGIYFPYNVIMSDHVAVSENYLRSISGFKRLSGPFPEASYLGVFLAPLGSYFLASFEMKRESNRLVSLLTFFVITLMVLLSTSTTGYVALGVGFVFCAIVVLTEKPSIRMFIANVGASLVMVLALVVLVGGELNVLVDSTIVGKLESQSFLVRATADQHALWLFFNTYGLGVGLGANRPSSFLAFLLSNVGVFGTLVFSAFIVNLLSRVYRVDKPLFVGFLTMLAGKVIAQPDISSATLWVWIFIIVLRLNVIPYREKSD